MNLRREKDGLLYFPNFQDSTLNEKDLESNEKLIVELKEKTFSFRDKASVRDPIQIGLRLDRSFKLLKNILLEAGFDS